MPNFCAKNSQRSEKVRQKGASRLVFGRKMGLNSALSRIARLDWLIEVTCLFQRDTLFDRWNSVARRGRSLNNATFPISL